MSWATLGINIFDVWNYVKILCIDWKFTKKGWKEQERERERERVDIDSWKLFYRQINFCDQRKIIENHACHMHESGKICWKLKEILETKENYLKIFHEFSFYLTKKWNMKITKSLPFEYQREKEKVWREKMRNEIKWIEEEAKEIFSRGVLLKLQSASSFLLLFFQHLEI